MTDGHGRTNEIEMDEIRHRMVALQKSAANLAQLDLDELASFLPSGTSKEQLMEIKNKLVQLHNLQNRRNDRNKNVIEGDNLSSLNENSNGRSSRYKTELCRPFEENGVCKYGARCQFAHGTSELRNLTRHPKYKSQLCRTFHSNGLCPYGHRCHFIHNQDEIRPVIPTTNAMNFNKKTWLDGYPDFGDWNRQRDRLPQNYADSMNAFQNPLLQRIISKPRMLRAAGVPAPPNSLPLGSFESTTGCSFGSADELSPPISPMVYSSDDPFTPQNMTRHGYSGSLSEMLSSFDQSMFRNSQHPEREIKVSSLSSSRSPENSSFGSLNGQLPFW